MVDLPEEVLANLFASLSHDDWSRCDQVCREWRRTIAQLRHNCFEADEGSLGVAGRYSTDIAVYAVHHARDEQTSEAGRRLQTSAETPEISVAEAPRSDAAASANAAASAAGNPLDSDPGPESCRGSRRADIGQLHSLLHWLGSLRVLRLRSLRIRDTDLLAVSQLSHLTRRAVLPHSSSARCLRLIHFALFASLFHCALFESVFAACLGADVCAAAERPLPHGCRHAALGS